MTSTSPNRYSGLARWLHWTMAAGIFAMLFIGIGMVATVSDLHLTLVAIHRPLGALLLALWAVRLLTRLVRGAPPPPADLPGWQRGAAHASHQALYAVMGRQPMVGWAMLSAGGAAADESRCGGVCIPAQRAHVSGLCLPGGRAAACGGRAVPLVGAAGSGVCQYGALSGASSEQRRTD